MVKKAVEKIFDVKVKSVNIVKVSGKVKNFRGKVGCRSSYKKAVVTLEPNQTIELMGGA